MKEASVKLPYAVTAYIERVQQDCADGKHADHRPFLQREADEIRNRCVTRWQNGQALIAEIKKDAPDDLAYCLRLYASKKSYGAYDLIDGTILDQKVIVPRYVFQLEKMRELRAILSKP